MPFSPSDPHSFQYKNTFAPFLHGHGLPFGDLLDHVQQRADEHHVVFGRCAKALWTPAVTLWAFLWQVLNSDRSCRQAVSRVVLAFALSREPESFDTAAYCRARAKLPTPFLERVALDLGRQLEEQAPSHWLWHGRRVRLVDGSTSLLPDTTANQEAFPQPKTQKRGLGFPMVRWVVLLSLATAAVLGLAYGPYAGKKTGETALFRQLLSQLRAGEVVVADRYYCSYFMVVLLQNMGVQVVLRMHQRRRYDFRRGRRLGREDHVVSWQRPSRPTWMDAETYAELPKTLEVREIRRQVHRRGCRVKEVVLATTLRDATDYPADEVAELYHQRWHAELDIRTLKVTLGLGELRCRTPAMVGKEIWLNCLAYNLVRQVAAQAALLAGRSPRTISFTASKQALLGAWEKLSFLEEETDYLPVATRLLEALGKEYVGDRPGRCEPRARKWRGKPHRLLDEPRAKATERLLNPRKRKRRKRRRA